MIPIGDRQVKYPSTVLHLVNEMCVCQGGQICIRDVSSHKLLRVFGVLGLGM